MGAETFEQRMERACKDRDIPGAVLVAGDVSGMFLSSNLENQLEISNTSQAAFDMRRRLATGV